MTFSQEIYQGNIIVKIDFNLLIIINLDRPPTNTSFVDIIHNFKTNLLNIPCYFPNDKTYKADKYIGCDEPNSQ